MDTDQRAMKKEKIGRKGAEKENIMKKVKLSALS